MAAVLRRKLRGGGAGAGDDAGAAASGAERALRLALGRAAQAEMALALVVASLRAETRSLPELLDLTEPGMFLGILEGRAEALGLIALGQPVLGGVIEHLTTGAIADVPQAARKPTRIDAAMTMPLVDRILQELELALPPVAHSADRDDRGADDWARGYRYASFLDDPRPIGLLLEETRYRVFRVEVALGSVARRGDILLALPADPPRAARQAAAMRGPDPDAAFRAQLQGVVLDAPARLEAVLTRLRLPLQAVMGWKPGVLVPLPLARAAEITLEAPRGRVAAQAALGQFSGARAVRLLPGRDMADAAPSQAPSLPLVAHAGAAAPPGGLDQAG